MHFRRIISKPTIASCFLAQSNRHWMNEKRNYNFLLLSNMFSSLLFQCSITVNCVVILTFIVYCREMVANRISCLISEQCQCILNKMNAHLVSSVRFWITLMFISFLLHVSEQHQCTSFLVDSIQHKCSYHFFCLFLNNTNSYSIPSVRFWTTSILILSIPLTYEQHQYLSHLLCLFLNNSTSNSTRLTCFWTTEMLISPCRLRKNIEHRKQTIWITKWL